MLRKIIILIVIIGFISYNLFSQQINDSTSIIKSTKDILVVKRLPNNIVIIKDKRVINELINKSDSEKSDSLFSSFFVSNITKYKSYYIIVLIGDDNKYYEVISPKKFYLFGKKIQIGKKYIFKLYPYYKKNYTNEMINYSEKQQAFPFIYKNNIFNVVINGNNIYTTPNLNNIYYNSKCDNSKNLEFNLDTYISILIRKGINATN